MAQSRRQRNRLDAIAWLRCAGCFTCGHSRKRARREDPRCPARWAVAMQLRCTFHVTFNGAIAVAMDGTYRCRSAAHISEGRHTGGRAPIDFAVSHRQGLGKGLGTGSIQMVCNNHRSHFSSFFGFFRFVDCMNCEWGTGNSGLRSVETKRFGL